jgi:hypothetical protein
MCAAGHVSFINNTNAVYIVAYFSGVNGTRVWVSAGSGSFVRNYGFSGALVRYSLPNSVVYGVQGAGTTLQDLDWFIGGGEIVGLSASGLTAPAAESGEGHEG